MTREIIIGICFQAENNNLPSSFQVSIIICSDAKTIEANYLDERANTKEQFNTKEQYYSTEYIITSWKHRQINATHHEPSIKQICYYEYGLAQYLTTVLSIQTPFISINLIIKFGPNLNKQAIRRILSLQMEKLHDVRRFFRDGSMTDDRWMDW